MRTAFRFADALETAGAIKAPAVSYTYSAVIQTVPVKRLKSTIM